MDVSAPGKTQQHGMQQGGAQGQVGHGLQVLSVPARGGVGHPNEKGPPGSKTRPHSGPETEGNARGKAVRAGAVGA